MSEKEKIFVFGASGHAKVVVDIIERQAKYEIAFLADDDPSLKGRDFFGCPVIGGKAELLAEGSVRRGVVAIGNNRARTAVTGWLESNGFSLVSAAHPSAQISRGVQIGDGTVVMAGAVINADSSIGKGCIVNTRASIDHDCRIGDFAHIAPGSILCGTVAVGNGTFVGAGSTIIPNLTVGSGVTVGAGSVVIRDIDADLKVAGVPAKII